MTDSLKKSIWIDAPVALVFEYFIDAQKMVLWSGQDAQLDPVPGGIYRLDMGVAGNIVGRFLEVERPHRVIYEVDPPAGVKATPSQVTIVLKDEAGGCRVDIEHRGLSDPFPLIAGRGWDHHLARLSVAAANGPPGRDSLCDRPFESML